MMPLCRWCTERHTLRWMCDPARDVLAALADKAAGYNMPSVEFDEPFIGTAGDVLGFGQPGDALVAQLVIKSVVVEVAGVPRPALVFTGVDDQDARLPQWLFAGSEEDVRRVCALTTERGEASIRSADKARSQG